MVRQLLKHSVPSTHPTTTCRHSHWTSPHEWGQRRSVYEAALAVGQAILTSGEGTLASVLNNQPASDQLVESGTPVSQTYKRGVLSVWPGLVDYAVAAVGCATVGGGACAMASRIAYPKVMVMCSRIEENTDVAGNDFSSGGRPSVADC
ncbi:hypothetical protein H310_06972 [Aphanomyces invadans]|uniref:Uncharacterized protein n=1 Tax=Aphanomyces invadans TaxID=157072 RepID=A0A024U7A4_9STRA|nr:hypothetical protein H310_06972 [Aphanomyces invadans]ETW01458.1 hypothetical protein H310_06972 [Aphanomyces invadans]|eukprot:XP_008870456.1 hypothetical protein H310_06972 [Aphanomyces invadans]